MLGFVLMFPMILARTGNNEVIVASVQSIGAIGGVVGGAVVLLIAVGGYMMVQRNKSQGANENPHLQNNHNNPPPFNPSAPPAHLEGK